MKVRLEALEFREDLAQLLSAQLRRHRLVSEDQVVHRVALFVLAVYLFRNLLPAQLRAAPAQPVDQRVHLALRGLRSLTVALRGLRSLTVALRGLHSLG